MISSDTSTAGAVTSVTSRAIRSPGPGRVVTGRGSAPPPTPPPPVRAYRRPPPSPDGPRLLVTVPPGRARDASVRPAAPGRDAGRRRRRPTATGSPGWAGGRNRGGGWRPATDRRWSARRCWSASAVGVGGGAPAGAGRSGSAVAWQVGRSWWSGSARRCRAGSVAVGRSGSVGVGLGWVSGRVGVRRLGRCRGRRRAGRAGATVRPARCSGWVSAPAARAPSARAGPGVGRWAGPARPGVRQGAAGSQPRRGRADAGCAGRREALADWSSASGSPPARPTGSG